MKFILVLDHKESFGLFDDRMNDIVPTAYRNEVNRMIRIYIEFMRGELLAGIIRSFSYMRQEIRMER